MPSAGEPGRPVSTTSAAWSPAITTWRMMRGPSGCSHANTRSATSRTTAPSVTMRPPRAAGRPARPRRRLPRSAARGAPDRHVVDLERAEPEHHRRDPRALDQQLLEARDEARADGAGDVVVERGGQQRDERERAVAVHDDAPLVDLLAGRVALRQHAHARPEVLDAVGEQVAVEHPRGGCELELRRGALAGAAQVGRQHRPAALAGDRGGGAREGLALPPSSTVTSTPGAWSSHVSGITARRRA